VNLSNDMMCRPLAVTGSLLHSVRCSQLEHTKADHVVNLMICRNDSYRFVTSVTAYLSVNDLNSILLPQAISAPQAKLDKSEAGRMEALADGEDVKDLVRS